MVFAYAILSVTSALVAFVFGYVAYDSSIRKRRKQAALSGAACLVLAVIAVVLGTMVFAPYFLS